MILSDVIHLVVLLTIVPLFLICLTALYGIRRYFNYLERAYQENNSTNQGNPNDSPFYYGNNEFGSDELHQKNDEFDARIRQYREELIAGQSPIYNVPHEEIDKQLIPKPKEEYAD